MSVPGVESDKVACLLYADDLVVLAESTGDLQAALDALGLWATTWEMEFGFKKCGAMVIHGNQQQKDELIQCKPKIKGTEIEIVAQYTYLGIPVDADFSLDTIAKEREAAVQRAVGSVSGFLRSRNVPIHVRLKALKSFILPVATFGGELLGMNEQIVHPIQSALDVGICYSMLEEVRATAAEQHCIWRLTCHRYMRCAVQLVAESARKPEI